MRLFCVFANNRNDFDYKTMNSLWLCSSVRCTHLLYLFIITSLQYTYFTYTETSISSNQEGNLTYNPPSFSSAASMLYHFPHLTQKDRFYRRLLSGCSRRDAFSMLSALYMQACIGEFACVYYALKITVYGPCRAKQKQQSSFKLVLKQPLV